MGPLINRGKVSRTYPQTKFTSIKPYYKLKSLQI